MKIQIHKQSDVPIRHQLAEQVVYQIVTGKWKAGDPLPSVRQLARQLGIHHNTVSDAYSSLVERGWLARRRGSKLHVQSAEKAMAATSLNEMVSGLVRYGRSQNWSLNELRARILARLNAEPPDHVLLVEAEQGLRKLLLKELQDSLDLPIRTCSPSDLQAKPELLVGAQVASPNYLSKAVKPLLASTRPLVELQFGTIEQVGQIVGKLGRPSIIAVASVSQAVLLMARALFGVVERKGHTLITCAIPGEQEKLRAADLIFCDAVAIKNVKNRRATEFRILADESIRSLTTAVK
jgi:DNA-binding transcriptional regulator YhcF (GntR family)